MSDKERQEVINLFKNNIKGYIAINDIQEAITSITYLFWNKKYLEKSKLDLENISSIESYLLQGEKDSDDFLWNIYNSIKPCMAESNLYNIFNYLNNLSEQKVIDIIC